MVVDRLSHFCICLCYLREHGMLQDHFMAKRRGICRSIANSELIPKRNSELIRIGDFQGRWQIVSFPGLSARGHWARLFGRSHHVQTGKHEYRKLALLLFCL